MPWINTLAVLFSTATPPGVAPPVNADDVLPMQPPWHTLEEVSTDLDGPIRPRAQKRIFLQFDGGNASSYIYSGYVNPFPGDDAKRYSVTQSVRQRLDRYDFVVEDRPGSGDYDVEWVGEWRDGDPGGAAGIAPGIDCWDGRGGEHSFTMAVNGGSDGIAEIILQELAHTWGLAHVDDVTDLLYPTTQGSNKVFKDECIQIVSDTDLNPSSSNCSHHQQACGSNSRQNSHQELLLIFGNAVPDTTPPTVQIVSPADGAGVAPAFDLVIALDDNLSPMAFDTTVALEGLGDTMSSLLVGEHKFPLSGLPDGWLTITVDATDDAGNMASDSIMVEVSGAGGTGGGDGGTGSGDGGTSGDSGGDSGTGSGSADGGSADDGGASGGTVTATGGLTTGGRGGQDDGGCGCRTNPPAGLFAWMLASLGLLARRRRG